MESAGVIDAASRECRMVVVYEMLCKTLKRCSEEVL